MILPDSETELLNQQYFMHWRLTRIKRTIPRVPVPRPLDLWALLPEEADPTIAMISGHRPTKPPVPQRPRSPCLPTYHPRPDRGTATFFHPKPTKSGDLSAFCSKWWVSFPDGPGPRAWMRRPRAWIPTPTSPSNPQPSFCSDKHKPSRSHRTHTHCIVFFAPVTLIHVKTIFQYFSLNVCP